MVDDFENLLAAAFPAANDAETIRGISEGLFLARDLLENTPMLKNLGGQDLRGHLQRVGIMFRLHDLSQRGDLPFATEIVAMPHGPWHWLEIRSKNFKAHVCRTIGPRDFPEEALSRQDERLRNQADFFKPVDAPLVEIAKDIPVLYAWLNFGADRAGSLQHLCWAMPPADDSDWLAHINILERTSSAVAPPPDEQKTPEVSRKIKLEFRDRVEDELKKKKQEG